MSDTIPTSITPLSEHNYQTWKRDISALLRAKSLWRIVSGQSTCPAKDDKKIEAWYEKASKAAGLIALSLSPSQSIYIEGIEDDLVKIWKVCGL